MILLFGYWFQSSERKHTLKFNSIQKLLEQIYEELALDINSIITIIENVTDGCKIDDMNKKKIQLKFKSVATNIKFILDSKPKEQADVDSKFFDFKDSIVEQLVLQEFTVNSEYLKEINTKSINLKNALRQKVYDIQ